MNDIASIQKHLNESGLLPKPLVVDGYWGPISETALLYALKSAKVFNAVRVLSFPEILVSIALKQVGVKEQGTNVGPQIVEYQKSTWLNPGAWPWCAAFVDWCIKEAIEQFKPIDKHEMIAFKRPQTASAWDLENWAKKQNPEIGLCPCLITAPKEVLRGDILVYSFSHCGIACDPSDLGFVKTIEGNTDADGTREGDGVYTKLRKISLVRSVIRFLCKTEKT